MVKVVNDLQFAELFQIRTIITVADAFLTKFSSNIWLLFMLNSIKEFDKSILSKNNLELIGLNVNFTSPRPPSLGHTSDIALIKSYSNRSKPNSFS